MYSSYLRRVIAGSVLFLIAAVSLWGCSKSNPVTSSEEFDLQTYLQRPLPEDRKAYDLALWHSAEVVAPDRLYERFKRDLALIEFRYQELLEKHVDPQKQKTYGPGFPHGWTCRGWFLASIDSVALDSIESGSNETWNGIVDEVGISWVASGPYSDGHYALSASFDWRVHPQYVIDAVASIEGMTGVFSSGGGWTYPSITPIDRGSGGFDYLVWIEYSDLLAPPYAAVLLFSVSRDGRVMLSKSATDEDLEQFWGDPSELAGWEKEAYELRYAYDYKVYWYNAGMQ